MAFNSKMEAAAQRSRKRPRSSSTPLSSPSSSTFSAYSLSVAKRRHLGRVLRAMVAILALQSSSVVVHGQFDGFQSMTEACPMDASITGYTSVAALNADIDTELGRIAAGGTTGQEMYRLVLCPGTTFDSLSGPLLPRLNQATYTCGENGNVSDECIFSGGTENIRIEDPAIEGYRVNTMTFVGMTLTAFTGWSVELLASAPTEAVFMNCLWQDFGAEGIARISNTQSTPMGLRVEMCNIQSSSGDSGDATVAVGFENNGGSIQLSGVNVKSVQVDDTMFRTVGNGATVVSQSSFTENRLPRVSDTQSGMATFVGLTISDNVQIVRMFQATGDSSSTSLQSSTIERNIGTNAYQIMRITDGAVATVQRVTVRQNIPVEYGLYVLVEMEGTTPMAMIEDVIFEGNTQEDWSLVMSEGPGAFVDMSRVQFIENTGGLMNIGAFFGGDVRFTQTCFTRNNHFLVALILEFSSFEAFDNFVDEEVSQICSGQDAEEGPGRLSVEQPGSMCFRGGENCNVDCLPNANDSPVCLAQTGPETVAPSGVPSQNGISPPPTPVPTMDVSDTPQPMSQPTPSPTGAQAPTDPPANPPVPEVPSPAPVAPVPVMPVPSTPTFPPFRPIPPRPSSPSRPPTRHPTRPVQPPTWPPSHPLRPPTRPPSKPVPIPTYRPPTYRPPNGKGKKNVKSRKSDKSDKSSKSKKGGKKHSPNGPKPPNLDQYYGIGFTRPLNNDQENFFGIGIASSRPNSNGLQSGTAPKVARGIGVVYDVDTTEAT